MEIFTTILDRIQNRAFVENLAFLLREVMAIILSSFGVIYTWVSSNLANPGPAVGAGVGVALGSLAAGIAFGPVGLALGSMIGGVSGGLIGGGAFNYQAHQQDMEERRRYREFIEARVLVRNQQEANGDRINQHDYDIYQVIGNILGDINLVARMI